MKNFAWASAALAAVPRAFRVWLVRGDNPAAQMRMPVIAFYMDRLYLDDSGTAVPYLAPRGMRSGAPLADMNEQAIRCAQLYV